MEEEKKYKKAKNEVPSFSEHFANIIFFFITMLSVVIIPVIIISIITGIVFLLIYVISFLGEEVDFFMPYYN